MEKSQSERSRPFILLAIWSTLLLPAVPLAFVSVWAALGYVGMLALPFAFF